jgi:hypothetical protein
MEVREMFKHWLRELRSHLAWSCAALAIAAGTTGVCRAQDVNAQNAAALQAQIAAQQQQIEELKRMMQSGAVHPAAADAAGAGDVKLDENAVKKIVGDYLKDNPGVGMPPSVQTGFESGKGFVIRSTNDPNYIKWQDDCKIPFELRIRGRIQNVYDYYKVTDTQNHLTGVNTSGATAPDFSQLEVKRMRLVFEGTAFDPDLRYHIQLDGGTRGLNALDPRLNSFNNPIGNVEGGQADGVTGPALRLFQCWVAYDFHGCASQKGCGCDCPEGTYAYAPTYTAIIGKLKPMGSLEEFLGSANEQFVEYSMSSWMFDSDADNMVEAAGVQVKAMEDRFFLQALVTNGADNQLPNAIMDNLPGFNVGFWYDFGGNWNEQRKRWDLYGDSISDIDYSCNPVFRVGAAANIVPMGRRSLYSQAELDFFKATPGAPFGTNVDGILNGGGLGTGGNFSGVASGVSPFGVDAFDAYTYDLYIAGKWRGFSIYNEWWLRNLDNFRGEKSAALPGTNSPILYTANSPSGATATALFPANRGLIDFGTALQAGYFLIPKKLEIAGRFAWISGESGNINGDGTFSTVRAASVGIKEANAVNGVQPNNTVPIGTTIRVVNGAFRNFNDAEEYGVGVNYYFKRQLVKWQTDFSYYHGGNPASNGQSAAGFIPGVDGWMIRSQFQFAF